MRRTYFRHGPAIVWWMFAVGQIVLTTALLWPALRSSPHTVPTTLGRASATVPLLNAWTIGWNADRLSHCLQGYWDAPIFFPERGALAFSEPQPATFVLAPVVWLTDSPVSAYHGYLWLSLFLNGLAAAVVLRRWNIGWFVTACGSVAVTLLPIAWDNLDAAQLLPLWGMLGSIHFLFRFSERPTGWRAFVLALACSSVFFLSVHHGVFFVVCLLPAAGWLIPRHERVRWLGLSAGAGAILSLLLMPMLVPMSRIHSLHDFQRSRQTQTALSARMSDWIRVPERAYWPSAQSQAGEWRPPVRPLHPGWARGVLALIAVVGVWRLGKHRVHALFLATLAAVSLVLSFGTNLSFGSQELWPVIGRIVPPLDNVRSIFRFAYITQLAVILLAAIGAEILVRTLRRRSLVLCRAASSWVLGRRLGAVLALACCSVVGAVLALEVPPPKLSLIGVPDPRAPRDWLSFLKERGQGQPILCLPFAENFSEAGLESSARWMLYATEHQLPMLNGYSGFFPRSWYTNVERWLKPQMTEELAHFLEQQSVRFIVVDRSKLTCFSGAPSPLVLGRFELMRVVEGNGGIDVWQLESKQ